MPHDYFSITAGAIPSSYSYYGNTDNIPFVLSGPTCRGNESSLFQCVDNNQIFGRIGKYRGDTDAERNTVGVKCERKLIFKATS